MWQTITLKTLRALLFDYTVPYTYSDDELTDLLIIAASYVRREGGFSYTVDIVNETITPDPSEDSNFLDLTCLKVCCMVDMAGARISQAGGYLIKDDTATVDFRDKAKHSIELLKNGYCNIYNQSIKEFLHDNISATAQAIVTPFRTWATDYDSDGLSFS